jgi:Tfp pilus assembly protein PilN
MKQDLNLLPRREQRPAVGLILPAVLVLLLLGAALYAGIVIPGNHLAELRQQQSQILSERSLYGDVASEYEAQNATLQDLLVKKAAISETFDTSHTPTTLLAVIERACPVTVQLTSLSVNEAGIVIQGTASSDTDVAQFMVNLRKSGLFEQTNISYVSPEEYTELPLLEGQQQKMQFSLILNYPQAETDGEKGGTES